MQPLDTPVLLSGAEPSVVLGTLLGHDQNWGHQSHCVPRATFLETTDVETPEWDQPCQRWRHKMGNGRAWDGAGLEMVAVLPAGSKPGNPASAPHQASSTSGPSLCHHWHWGR